MLRCSGVVVIYGFVILYCTVVVGTRGNGDSHMKGTGMLVEKLELKP